MGLTSSSTGKNINEKDIFNKKLDYNYTIALAGNPNVGKTSIFNNLTGMHQHTGNWPGKTVANAYGISKYKDKNILFVDLPGTYSLMSNSTEEEIARNYICFGNPDYTIVVVDATCLERSLNLVFQVLEMTSKVIVCVNLLDEAKKKSIKIDLDKLSKMLGVPVVGTVAKSKKTLNFLLDTLLSNLNKDYKNNPNIYKMTYTQTVENYVSEIENNIKSMLPKEKEYLSRWISLKLLDENSSIIADLKSHLKIDLDNNSYLQEKLSKFKAELKTKGLSLSSLRDEIVCSIISEAERVRKETCTFSASKYNIKNKKIDKILTSKKFGIPIMLLFFALIFWLTIVGANYPSQILSDFFGKLQIILLSFLESLHCPEFLTNVLIYRNVSNSNLGGFCNASTYGNILPSVYSS